MKRKISTIAKTLFVLVFITYMNACSPECKDCIEIPPAIAPDAIALQNIDHLIDTATANAWVARYIANKDSICNNKVGLDSNILANSEQFNKQDLLKILCLKDCIGLKIAYGMDSNFVVHQIISGVSTTFTEIFIPDSSTGTIVYKKLETGQMCPSYCPSPGGG